MLPSLYCLSAVPVTGEDNPALIRVILTGNSIFCLVGFLDSDTETDVCFLSLTKVSMGQVITVQDHELLQWRLTQPIRPGLSSQKYFRSKSPILGFSSRPMKKSYRGFPERDRRMNAFKKKKTL